MTYIVRYKDKKPAYNLNNSVRNYLKHMIGRGPVTPELDPTRVRVSGTNVIIASPSVSKSWLEKILATSNAKHRLEEVTA